MKNLGPRLWEYRARKHFKAGYSQPTISNFQILNIEECGFDVTFVNINVSLSFYRVGILGIFGNLLTLLVLNRSKGTNFNQLLGFLSIIDMLLIICFILMSACTTGKRQSV